MFWKTKEFGPALCKATFPSSSPLTPATESGIRERKAEFGRGVPVCKFIALLAMPPSG
jgi:hypothetical protein